MNDSIAQYINVIVSDEEIPTNNAADVEAILTKAEVETQAQFVLVRNKMRSMSKDEIQELVYMTPNLVREEFED